MKDLKQLLEMIRDVEREACGGTFCPEGFIIWFGAMAIIAFLVVVIWRPI